VGVSRLANRLAGAGAPSRADVREVDPSPVRAPLGWRAVRAFGVLCLAAALGVAGYLAWLLWGTGLQTARAQRELREAFVERLEASAGGPSSGGTVVPEAPPGRPVRTRPLRPPTVLPGDPVGILRIPRIGVDWVVVEGTGVEELRMGPGHYPGTAFPWDPAGRVAIAGHRTTYGRPFWSLDRVAPGDRVELVTEVGTFRYRVTRVAEVMPWETWVVEQTARPTLALTTCTPRFSAARRLVVFADRVSP
jgi:sortase A